jgi:hypothetical protein
MKLVELLSVKTFHDIFGKKDVWINVPPDKLHDLKPSFYALIDGTYKPLFGTSHPALTNNMIDSSNFWEAIDLDADPDADAIIFGRKTSHGIKIRGIAHDSEKTSKSQLISRLVQVLNEPGFWIEASAKVEDVLYSRNVPVVKDVELIREIFNDPHIQMTGDRYRYKRRTYVETMFGVPK